MWTPSSGYKLVGQHKRVSLLQSLSSLASACISWVCSTTRRGYHRRSYSLGIFPWHTTHSFVWRGLAAQDLLELLVWRSVVQHGERGHVRRWLLHPSKAAGPARCSTKCQASKFNFCKLLVEICQAPSIMLVVLGQLDNTGWSAGNVCKVMWHTCV